MPAGIEFDAPDPGGPIVERPIKTSTKKPFGLSLSKANTGGQLRFDKLTANGNGFAETHYY